MPVVESQMVWPKVGMGFRECVLRYFSKRSCSWAVKVEVEDLVERVSFMVFSGEGVVLLLGSVGGGRVTMCWNSLDCCRCGMMVGLR